MKHDIQNKEKDLEAISEIISRYLDNNEGKPLHLLEIAYEADTAVGIRIASWLSDIGDYFKKEYGENQIFQHLDNLVSKCLIGGDTIH